MKEYYNSDKNNFYKLVYDLLKYGYSVGELMYIFGDAVDDLDNEYN